MVLRALIATSLVLVSYVTADAAELPAIRVSATNKVPACATPGRLLTFLKDRNGKLDPRFDGIATEYMRHGEELSIRWDFAFFQMLLETGNLTFTGDVNARQNNFAGLGATGKGEPGETFKDVSTGVRAHLEHLVMYSGEKVPNPVAERTRKVQEWGVLTEWQKSIKGPVTFAQLAKKWAPSTRKYAADIDSVADSFMSGTCKQSDPRPELVAAARKSLLDEAIRVTKPATTAPPSAGEEAAKRAVAAAKTGGDGRSSLGAPAAQNAAPAKPGAEQIAPAVTGVKLLNAAKPDVPEPAPVGVPRAADADQSSAPAYAAAPTQIAAAANAASAVKPGKAPPVKEAGKDPKDPAKCNVLTASYGGQKAVIIKAVAGDLVNYTVLDVNEGSETRETEAYIAAYAKGGKLVGDFKSQAMALDKAFELCPEG